MGYTHYFRQSRSATPKEWENITTDFKYLLASAALPPIQIEDDAMEDPLIDNEEVRFNGVGSNGHETMILERHGHGFQFCKTARKPYDDAVTALLILAHYHAPDIWEIHSDGNPEEWQAGLDIARRVQENAELPLSI